MRTFLILAALALALSLLSAGEVNVSWTASDGAQGYRVYSGTDSGDYGDPLDVTTTTTPLMGLLDGCVQQFVAVTAYNVLGESEFTTALPFYPRPVLVGEPTVEGEAPDQFLVFMGGNFAPGMTLTFNNESAPFEFDCEELRIPVVTVPGLGQGQSATLQLCNGSVCLQKVILPVNAPDTVTVT